MRFFLLFLITVACGPSSTPTPQTGDNKLPVEDQGPHPAVIAAVSHPERPADDRARDDDRNPLAVLDFFQIRPEMTVADLMSGKGYYSELLALVVGKNGKVFAHNNKFVAERFAREPLQKRFSERDFQQVEIWERELENLDFSPGSLDAAIMVLFYHDTYWLETDRPTMLKSIYKSLKPGGVFGVIDHSAQVGSGISAVKTLHRIESPIVKQEVIAAGFVFEAESAVLRHPEDDMTENVFNESIRGKTDRFIFRFRKPK